MFRRLKNGDGDAWTKFDRKYRPMLKRFARSRGLQDADADELAEVVIIAVFKKIGEWVYDRSKGKFRSYITTIIVNEIINLKRTQKPFQNVLDEVIADPKSFNSLLDVLEKIEETEKEAYQLETIDSMARKANEKLWQAWHLTKTQGLSGREAAERLGVSENNINVMKIRFRKLLQDLREKLFDEPK